MAVPAFEEYQIGWICALPVEAAAAQEMLDESFGPPEEQDSSDTNIYTLGRIGRHFVAIACLGGQYGTTSATTVANNMVRTFSKSLRVGLMVGIGGGIPSASHDIRLGDIVVSYPTDTCGGVIQHDMGKVGEGGRLTRTGSLNSPPRILLAAVNQMRAAALREDPLYPSYIKQAVQRNNRTRRNFGQPEQQMDHLFQFQYKHPSNAATCDGCLDKWKVEREEREDKEPQPHYGIIASGNVVIKDGQLREQLWKETGALCFEMEAAGLMQDFPCVVIRGICDYADSHKNKQWQGYAALAAASYAKELLGYVPRGQVLQEKLVAELTSVTRALKDLRQTTKKVEQKIDLQGLSIAKGAAFDSYENQNEVCLDGTRVELLHDIEEWATSAAGKCIFWLNGKAGTGKSTVSRTLATRLQRRGLLGASFFFKRGEENRTNAKRLFPTIMAQLMFVIPELRPEIQKAIQSDPYISERAPGEQFHKLVLKSLLNVDLNQTVTMVIVIDALDECEPGTYNDIKAILRLLPQVRLSKGIQLRFFLTSRPELPIQWVFREIKADYKNFDLYDVPTTEITNDISIYLGEAFSKIRLQHGISPSWPGGEALQVLLARTVPLFIAATTLCRFINGSWDPQDCLERVIADQSIYVSAMASTYLPVLKQLFIGQSKRENQRLVENFKQIIGSIIMLVTPLSVPSLSKFLSMETIKIQKLLDRLHSLLDVPDDLDKPVRILHLSFRDFLLDKEIKETADGKQFWIDKEVMHRDLTHHCLQLMGSRLKRNICKLSSEGTLRSEIEPLDIEHHLPLELQYACRYWAEHLSQSLDQIDQLAKAFSFLRTHFLHWLEVMSILGYLSEVVRVVIKLQSIIQNKTYPEISDFLHDAKRFILKNRQIAETAPLQLYSSALMFCPRCSITRGMFKSNLSNWLQSPKVEEAWSAELQTLEGHSDSVNSVAFSPDSQLLASSSNDETIKLWDPSTGELRQTLKGHSNWVRSIAFSSNGQLLASGSNDKTIKIWDPSTGELHQTLEGHSHWVRSIAFSSNGQLLASGSDDKTVKLWDPSTGKLRQTLDGHSYWVSSVAFSPDSRLLASGSSDETIKLWDPSTGELRQTLKGHSSRIRSLAFSAKSQLLASGSDDRTVKLWNPSTGELCQTLKGHSSWVLSLAFLPDGWLLASASDDNTVKLWDPSTGELHQTLQGHSNSVNSITFSSNGQLLASCSDDKTVNLWDPNTGKLRQALIGHSMWVESVAFSPDSQLLASGSYDDTVKLWDPSTGELRQTLKGHSSWVYSVAFSPDSQLLASSSNDETIKLWDPSTGELRQTLEDHSNRVCSLTFSSNGQLLASGSDDKTIKLWDPNTGELRQTLKGHSNWVRSIAFSSNGQLLASGSDDKTIKLWDPNTGKLCQTLKGHSNWVRSVAFSPNGQLLASGSDDKTIKLWDPSTGKLRQTHKGHFQWVWSEKNALISIEDHQWLCFQHQKILWLPTDYRVMCLANNGSVLALGHKSGWVSFISYDDRLLD